MRFLIVSATQLVLFTSIGVTLQAQNTKDKDNKPQTTTVDAWRQALPQSEQPSNTVPSATQETAGKIKESKEQTEKRILDLEQSLMESIRLRDGAGLDALISDDFILAGLNLPGDQPDKKRFINWVVNQLQVRSYEIEKMQVRLLSAVAIVTVNYKRQATVDGSGSDGDFAVTSVWTRNGQIWQVTSHHASRPSKS